MQNSRLETLLVYLKENPEDAFTLYAIALEYRKTDVLKALSFFKKLFNEQPDYVATYYQLAKLLEEEFGDIKEARQVYEKGIEISTKNNDSLALRELKNAHRQLLDDLE